MRIIKFNQFISESIIPQQDDPPEIASRINTFNEMEKKIKDFDTHKMDINNIYMTYKDEADLINKLFNRKFITKKSQNKKEIKFENELLAIWAQSCEKRRKIKKIEDSITEIENDTKNMESNIQKDPSLKESESELISRNSEKISDKKTQITTLQKEIMDSEREAKTKLDQLKKDLILNKQKIDKWKITKSIEGNK